MVLVHVVSLWERVGVRTPVGTCAENIITVIVVDVLYRLQLVHGTDHVGRLHPEAGYALSV